MSNRRALLLLLAFALFTPLAAMLGLYDTSLQELGGVVAPAIGAVTALGLARWFNTDNRRGQRR